MTVRAKSTWTARRTSLLPSSVRAVDGSLLGAGVLLGSAAAVWYAWQNMNTQGGARALSSAPVLDPAKRGSSTPTSMTAQERRVHASSMTKGRIIDEEISEDDEDDENDDDFRFNKSQPIYVLPSSQSKLRIFSGTANPVLAAEIAMQLSCQLGRSSVGRYADGEIFVNLHDNVRGKDVFIVQPTCFPVNDNLMELLLFVSTLKRSSAKRVTAVIPYFGYARQLENEDSCETLAGADVAQMLQAAGVDRVIAVDLHKAQVQGFFDARVPVENINPLPSALPFFTHKPYLNNNPVIVTPSSSGTERAREFQRLLRASGVEADLGLTYVERAGSVAEVDHSHHTSVEASDRVVLVGDVKGKDVIIVDDMVDTGSRMTKVAELVKKAGAQRIRGLATHGVLTKGAIANVTASHLHELVTFNTIPLPHDRSSPKIRTLTVSALLAEAIRRVHTKANLETMYEEYEKPLAQPRP